MRRLWRRGIASEAIAHVGRVAQRHTAKCAGVVSGRLRVANHGTESLPEDLGALHVKAHIRVARPRQGLVDAQGELTVIARELNHRHGAEERTPKRRQARVNERDGRHRRRDDA